MRLGPIGTTTIFQSRWAVNLFRIALTFLLITLAGAAEAYPTATCWKRQGSASDPCSGSFGAAQAWALANVYTSGNTFASCTEPGDGTGTCSLRNSSNVHVAWITFVGLTGNNGYCPGGGTQSGSSCNCTAPAVDTGTACETPACPTAGSPMGYHSLTAGWTLSPVTGANDYVGGWATGIYGSTHCINNGADLCGATVDPNVGSQSCWRSQEPAAGSGLYRVSCDMAMLSAGTSVCSQSGNNPSNPNAPAPACPTGNVGEVNGTSVCLGTIPTAGINLGAPEGAGNPRAGTGSEQTNGEREPSTGGGGGPDARGGPDVTTGPGGTGTGGNRIPTGGGTGSSDGSGIEFPTDYNREVTQAAVLAELKKARKIDETGTPTGEGVDTDAKTAADGEQTKLTTKLSGIVAGEGAPDRSWGFGIMFPSNCSAMTVGTANWGFFQVDLCEWQDIAHDLMSLVWIAATIFVCIGMVSRAISAG